MLKTALIHYIRSTLSQGYDKNAVYSYLLQLGWDARDIADSFYLVEQEIRTKQMQMQGFQLQSQMQAKIQRQKMQPQIQQMQMMHPQMRINNFQQYPMPKPFEPASPMANFILPIVGVFLILIMSGGIFLFANLGKTTVGVPTGIQPEGNVKLSPPKEAAKETQQQEPVIISQEPQQGRTPAKLQETPQNNSQEPAPAETQPALTCMDQFGIECLEGEICPGELLPATDADKCCSVMCE